LSHTLLWQIILTGHKDLLHNKTQVTNSVEEQPVISEMQNFILF